MLIVRGGGGRFMEENLKTRIDDSVVKALDDEELATKLVEARNVYELYHWLSKNRDLNYSYDDFCNYSVYCEKLVSDVLNKEMPYSEKALKLVRIYENICKDEKEVEVFDSLKRIDEVLNYFNSLGQGNYSLGDVIDFFGFQLFMTCKCILSLSFARSCCVNLSKNGLMHDDYLDCAGGVGGSKRRWLGGVLGALSIMSSGFGGINTVSAYGESDKSMSDVANLDYVEEPNGGFIREGNSVNADVNDTASGFSFKGFGSFVVGTLLAKGMKFVFDKVGLGEYAPKDMKGVMDLPEQLKKSKEMFEKLMNRYNSSGSINRGKKVGEMITNENDELFNFLASRVKGQNAAIQKIVDLSVRPFLNDIMGNAIKREKKLRYSENINPEDVRTYVASLYGDRGVGKTRVMNILQDEVFDSNGIPCITISVGSFVGAKGKKSFVEYMSEQEAFTSKLEEIKYMKNFVLCFDEVDKIQDEAQLLDFMETIRSIADKTQITYKDTSNGDKNVKVSTIQCESGLVIISSNALSPHEKLKKDRDLGAASAAAGVVDLMAAPPANWRKESLSNDPSILSRMSHVTFENTNDNTADAVADTLVMEAQRDWYQINNINVELDDAFTYNALRLLKYLGYDPQKDGVREIRNQIVSIMKTEFSRKYTEATRKFNKLINEGKDPAKIRFLFEWRKCSGDDNMALMGKNGKISPIVPVFSCRYIDDVDNIKLRLFNHNTNSDKDIWRKLDATSVKYFKEMMGRLEDWKVYAHQCRVKNAMESKFDIAKYKIRDAYRELKYSMLKDVRTTVSKEHLEKSMVKALKQWKKSARLTVSEEEVIFNSLLSIIDEWSKSADSAKT